MSYQCRDPCRDPDPDRHQNLIICSLAYCQPSVKISCKFVEKFLCKVERCYLTDKQTNNDDYMSSLAEVISRRSNYISSLAEVISRRSTLLVVWSASTTAFRFRTDYCTDFMPFMTEPFLRSISGFVFP